MLNTAPDKAADETTLFQYPISSCVCLSYYIPTDRPTDKCSPRYGPSLSSLASLFFSLFFLSALFSLPFRPFSLPRIVRRNYKHDNSSFLSFSPIKIREIVVVITSRRRRFFGHGT